ncbi:hypothetical protein [Actinophytocola xanthii]|uniref:Transporter n=1 Tax=Actinophytocola xanthii TaxID=1912961 RepID=A0A1Q8CQK3_9PSEU|nr:hypothetical protein [Actinophytocola xanthii]OLF16636.1 hypothetical protein BU204_15665 [Actinophytocola xanthii]
MVGVLIRMKWRVLRHSLRGKEAVLTVGGAILGLLAAVLTVLVAAADFPTPGVDTDVLAGLLLLWTLGWLFAPLFTGGGDETLRPEHFALLPFTPRQLAAGLLGAAFLGVPAIVTALAFCALVVHAAGSLPAVVVAVLALPLQLALAVLLSRVAMAGLGAALQSRRGRDLGVLLAALVGVMVFFAQALVQTLGPVVVDGDSPALTAVLRWVPSGWGPVAVDAAGRGEWPLVLAALAGLVVLGGGLLAVWGVLLHRRTTRVPVNVGPSARGSGSVARRLPATPVGAVVAKELRTWFRDPRRRVALLSAVIVALVASVPPALQGEGGGGIPFTGLVVMTVGCLLAGNLYGMDGSALWLTLVTPEAAAADVRGRQLAWLLLITPVAAVLVVVLPALTEPATYPWVLALAPALAGGGSGLVVLLSVFTAYPLPDQRANPFSAGNNPGLLRVLLQLAITLLLAVVALPVVAVVWLGSGVAPLEWLGVPTGVAVGVLCWWWWGRIAARRLAERGPELLAVVAKHV